jgi:hypothetical protein
MQYPTGLPYQSMLRPGLLGLATDSQVSACLLLRLTWSFIKMLMIGLTLAFFLLQSQCRQSWLVERNVNGACSLLLERWQGAEVDQQPQQNINLGL